MRKCLTLILCFFWK